MVLKTQLARMSRKEKQRIFSELNMDPMLRRKRLFRGAKKVIAKEIGLNRNRVFKDRELRRARKDESDRKASVIQSWMRDPANSAMLPGKRDGAKKKKGGQQPAIEVQKVVLMDTLVNCHQKFTADCAVEDTVSLPTFCRARPCDVKLFHVLKHQSCLCKQHSNIGYMCQAIKDLPMSTTSLIAMDDQAIWDTIEAHPSAYVKYNVWDRPQAQEMEGQEKPKKKKDNHPGEEKEEKESTSGQRLFQRLSTKTAFLEKFKLLMPPFRAHCARVENQNQQLKTLKDRLPMHQAVIQVDYAENWSTSYAKEIQSAYYNKPQVTLKAIVVKLRDYTVLPADPNDKDWTPEEDDTGTLYHYNYVGVSDDHTHGFEETFTFIEELIKILRQKHPHLQYVWFVSDSPSSQYRNRYICQMLMDSLNLFKVRCAWMWLESGHGKGPCDGVGGAIKRIASRETKKSVTIQNADDFATTVHSEKIELIHKTKEEIAEKRASGKCRKCRAAGSVDGISKAHQAVVIDRVLYIRDLSCFQDCCMREDGRMIKNCPGWKAVTNMGISYSDDEYEADEDQVPSTVNEARLLNEMPFPDEVLDPDSDSEEEEEQDRPRFYGASTAARATRRSVRRTIKRRKGGARK